MKQSLRPAADESIAFGAITIPVLGNTVNFECGPQTADVGCVRNGCGDDMSSSPLLPRPTRSAALLVDAAPTDRLSKFGPAMNRVQTESIKLIRDVSMRDVRCQRFDRMQF